MKDSHGQGTGWPVGRGTNAGLRTPSYKMGQGQGGTQDGHNPLLSLHGEECLRVRKQEVAYKITSRSSHSSREASG